MICFPFTNIFAEIEESGQLTCADGNKYKIKTKKSEEGWLEFKDPNAPKYYDTCAYGYLLKFEKGNFIISSGLRHSGEDGIEEWDKGWKVIEDAMGKFLDKFIKNENELQISSYTMKCLKEDTERHIQASLAVERNGKEDFFDCSLKGFVLNHNEYIDLSIIEDIRILNKNPNIVTRGSCSGHDDEEPFVCVIFKDKKTRDEYRKKLEPMGIEFKKEEDISILDPEKYRDIVIHEEWMLKPISPIRAKQFWNNIMQIMSK